MIEVEASAAAPRFGVSYFGNRYPHHAQADLEAMAAAGCAFVVLVMTEADLRWSPGTMRELVQTARECGLQPWLTAWAIGGVFGGETASYAVGEHHEACQRDSDGKHLPALCPRQPVFRALLESWLDVAAAAGAPIVQWDEPQLARAYREGATAYACSCDLCQEAFAARFGGPMPAVATAEVAQLNDDLLAELIAWLAERAQRRGLQSAVVLLPDENYDPARARAAAELPGVRYFGSTPFWIRQGVDGEAMPAYLAAWAARLVEATAGTRAAPFAWVQGFNVPAGREPEIGQAIETMVDDGVRTVAVWSYLACAAMSELACDDPPTAWNAVVQAFQRAGAASHP